MLLWAQFQGDEIYWSKLGLEFHKLCTLYSMW